jgi:hypothetical protein
LKIKILYAPLTSLKNKEQLFNSIGLNINESQILFHQLNG